MNSDISYDATIMKWPMRASPVALFFSLGLVLADCAGPSRPLPGTPTSLTCVPYAERVSGIVLPGDAYNWWRAARGRYERRHQPEVGSVLVFRSIPAMPLGHVSVVTAVLSPRRILVEHANWVPHRINHDQLVVDVSAANNWSRVRVWYPPIDALGNTTFPTYGFLFP